MSSAPGDNYACNLGSTVKIGKYCKIPLWVTSSPMSHFPYPDEVSTCMQRFFQWRERTETEQEFHPLIIAYQTMAYFLHIHPFPDGNKSI